MMLRRKKRMGNEEKMADAMKREIKGEHDMRRWKRRYWTENKGGLAQNKKKNNERKTPKKESV